MHQEDQQKKLYNIVHTPTNQDLFSRPQLENSLQLRVFFSSKLLGKFKYQMKLRGRGCSNCQSADIWGRGLAKSLYYFYSGWKSLIHSFSFSMYGIWGRGRGWLKRQNTVIWEKGV